MKENMKEKKCGCITYQDYLAEEIDINTSYSDYNEYNDFSDDDYCHKCHPLLRVENKIQEVLKKGTKLDSEEKLFIVLHNKRIAINRERYMDSLLNDIQFVECDIRELEDFKKCRNYLEDVCVCEYI